jgi:hypothetical protein
MGGGLRRWTLVVVLCAVLLPAASTPVAHAQPAMSIGFIVDAPAVTPSPAAKGVAESVTTGSDAWESQPGSGNGPEVR